MPMMEIDIQWIFILVSTSVLIGPESFVNKFSQGYNDFKWLICMIIILLLTLSSNFEPISTNAVGLYHNTFQLSSPFTLTLLPLSAR